MSKRKLFVTICILSFFGLLFLSGLTAVALAQYPPPFEISVIPQADQAVAGEPFTYTVVITSLSQTIQEDITVVNVPLPEGTTFLDTKFADVNWAVSKPNPGESGEIRWLTLEPINPGDVFSFTLIIQIPIKEMQELIQNNYGVALGSPDNLVVSGSSIRTAIVTPTPSPTPTELPPSPTPSPSKTTNVSPTIQPTMATSTLPSTRQTVAVDAKEISVTGTAVERNNSSDSTPILGIFIFGLLIISISTVALIWFFRRK